MVLRDEKDGVGVRSLVFLIGPPHIAENTVYACCTPRHTRVHWHIAVAFGLTTQGIRPPTDSSFSK